MANTTTLPTGTQNSLSGLRAGKPVALKPPGMLPVSRAGLSDISDRQELLLPGSDPTERPDGVICRDGFKTVP